MSSIYPSPLAGQRVTAALLQAMLPTIIVKTASTDRSSTTTLADDPELTTTLAANAIYFVEFFLFFAGNLGDMKTAWTVPSGATGNRSAIGPGSNADGGTSNAMDNISGRFGVHGYSTTVAYGGRTTGSTASLSQEAAIETSLMTTTNAGTCAIQWAQVTSNANATRMASGSLCRITRIS